MDAAAEAEFREFVIARRHRLLRTAYLLTGDHASAEDLVQDALVRAHRHWRRVARAEAPDAYVRRILINLHNSWWRRWRGRGEHLTAQVPDRATGDPNTAYDLRDELWGALGKLPPRMRAVIVLRYYDDLSEAETARALGCSAGSVKSQASRGLARLRDALPRNADADGAVTLPTAPAMNLRRT